MDKFEKYFVFHRIFYTLYRFFVFDENTEKSDEYNFNMLIFNFLINFTFC